VLTVRCCLRLQRQWHSPRRESVLEGIGKQERKVRLAKEDDVNGKRLLVLMICGLLVQALAVVAGEVPEQFTGRVVDAGGALPGATSAFFTINIDEYTTDEEAMGFVSLLAEGGQDALEKALWDLDKGWIRVGGSLGYPLAITRSIKAEGGRIIRVMTDRPISMFESMRGLRSKDYPFGIIELQLDEEGKGEGRLIAAAQVEFNKEGTIEIESLGTEPLRLMNVETKVKKEKKK
jgi:hypothetical protein